MREKIILAPGANRTELIRSLALCGKGSFGVRIYNSAYSLAADMLLRKGIVNDNVMTDREAVYLVFSCMKSVKAFDNSSFTDAINMAGSFSTLRKLITADEGAQMERLVRESDFAAKNRSFLEAFGEYRNSLAGRKDSIDVIRQAVETVRDVDAEFISLSEFPLLPLERELINRLSGNSAREMSIRGLFGVEEKPYHDIRYIRAYGNSNEVENTLNYIFENEINLDDCVIAVTDQNKYGQLMLEYSQKYDIDIAFAGGISINNSEPARLLRLYHQWDANGYHGVDALWDMLNSSCFDMEKLRERFSSEISRSVFRNTADRAGQLKFSPDLSENRKKAEQYMPLITEKDRIDAEVLMVLAEELGRDVCSFLSEYSVIKNGSDEEALRIITDMIGGYLKYNPSGSYTDIIENILSSNVNRSVSREGSLTVTGIRGALSSCRRHLFVLGLSANNFPKAARENYLLLDEDLKLYGADVPDSASLTERKKQELHDLLSLYSSLNNDITLSYSCYDMAAIKEENASSVLFEIYQKQYPGNTIEDYERMLKESETSYLQNKLSLSKQVLSSLGSDQILKGIPQGDVITVPYDGSRTFSPSALEIFFSCRKRFYLSSILGIEEPDPDDPFTVIDARDMGTLVHSVMEYLADNPRVSEREFADHARQMFDEYLKTRTPINKEMTDSARTEFMDMAVKGFRNDPHNEVIAAEEKFSVMHWDSGIGIYGYPDRVEIDENGQYLIADYKTKRRYDHKPDDIDSCLQVVLYAYMMSHRKENRLPISYCTYRYLRYNEPVNCRYDADMENQLKTKLLEVRDALDSGHFPCTDNDDDCRYCRFASVCGKNRGSEVTDNE
ncbi:MAG: PD-(D/E)XK nuclease family protein [Erysipelotrichaceae bacterium]|nr:PD-(D/E)XK nuclease family protein [Erysipelotrichaceae bacterium]